ncbi:ImuA family protein [Ancylobacter defluvii]|uniref:Protein ImuA n=2 Tax=Ancylobacter defluvii TaxID=1282440 RepID=A0A9W6NB25_9HYPH|nr:hypothetical protein [Ancylobacter defluvii]MBS7585877.1 hypothetical protein [Ancylobacter defluvii]GLK84253.1 hypothetical protein GCM10017653_23230 [Ancylobacter defluvii]
MSMTPAVSALRGVLAGLEAERLPGNTQFFHLGAPGADGALGGPLACGALHEVFAAAAGDMAAAAGFTLALAQRASSARSAGGARPLLWVRQETVDTEAGRLAATGLHTLGIDPARLLLVRAPGAEAALRAADDAVRCSALGAVILEPWGEPKALDLTATRRLSLRAGDSGVTVLLLRPTGRPGPSAGVTRWQVRGAPSRPLAGDAPGAPSFLVELLRHRAGHAGVSWHLEWDRETCSFRDIVALPRFVVSVPGRRTAGEAATPLPFRRTG